MIDLKSNVLDSSKSKWLETNNMTIIKRLPNHEDFILKL